MIQIALVLFLLIPAQLDDELKTVASLTAAGSHAEALTLASRLIAEYPDSIEAHIAYQDLRLAQGAGKELIREYEARLTGRASPPDAIYLHARLLEGSRGVTCLKKVLKVAPDHFYALCTLAAEYIEVGKYRDASRLLTKACRANPHSAVPMNSIAWMAECEGDLVRAEESYRQAIERDAGHAVSHLNLGVLLVTTGRLDEAEPVLETARKLAPGSPMPLLAKGLLLEARDDCEGALELFQAAVEMKTNTLASLNMLGTAYVDLGEFGLAREALSKALKEKKDDIPTLLNFCHLALAEGKPEVATSWVRKALAADSKCAHAYFLLGVCMSTLRKMKSAENCFLRATKMDPENVPYWRALGSHYTAMGKWRDAVRTLDHACDMHPDVVGLLLDLAFAFSGAGESQRAANTFEAVLEQDPDELKAWLTLGLLYMEKLRKPEEAIRAFEEYLQREGDDKRVKEWLEALQK